MELIEPTIVQFRETRASRGAAALLMQLSLSDPQRDVHLRQVVATG